MTLDEIQRREELVREAEARIRDRKLALRKAQEEYAEQEARKKGIIYNETPVMVTEKARPAGQKTTGPFMISGLDDWWVGKPRYRIVKTKKDGSASLQLAGFSFVGLDQIEVAG